MRFSLWSNMFPSPEAPFYGTFVSSAYDAWGQVFPAEAIHKVVIDRPSRHLLGKIKNYFFLYLGCLKDIFFRKPDIVEIHYPFFFIPLLFFLKTKSVVLRFHGSDLEKVLNSKLFLWMFDFNEEKLRCIVVPSGYYKERVVGELGYKGVVLIVSPDSVSDIFYPKKEQGVPGFVIGVVGRLEKEKNVQEVIEAISILDIPDVKLLVVGDGPFKDSLMAQASRLGVNAKIDWVGLVSRDSLVEYFHRMSVFVFPSTRTAESFGLVALEALASGIPVIARESLLGAKEYLNNRNAIFYQNSSSSLKESLDFFYGLSEDEKNEMMAEGLSSASTFNFDDAVLGGVRRIMSLER